MKGLERVKGMEGILKAAIVNNQTKLQDIKRSKDKLKQDVQIQETKVEEFKEAIRNLTAFIRDHETNYEANKLEVLRLGEQIAIMNSEYNGFTADIEQNQQGQRALEDQNTQLQGDRRACDTERTRVQHFADAHIAVSVDLSQARANYEAQLGIFNRISNSQLHGKVNILKAQISKKEAEYRNASQGLHNIKVEALSKHPTLAAETQEAEQNHTRKHGDHAVATAELIRFKRELSKIDQEASGKALKPESFNDPATVEQAKDIQSKLNTQLRSKMNEESSAETEASHHKRKQEECGRSLSIRETMQGALEDLEVGTGTTPPVTLPGDDQQLRTFIKEIQSKLKEMGKRVIQSQERLTDRYEAIVTLLGQPDEPGCDNAMKPKLKALSQRELVHGATEIRDNARVRSAIIQQELEDIEKDRQSILTEIDIIYAQARHLLNSAERISRIPDSIKAWAGQPFLRIKLREASPADVKVRLAELLDAVLKEAGTGLPEHRPGFWPGWHRHLHPKTRRNPASRPHAG